MKEKVDVSVIIINYNTQVLTANCIRSVYQHTSDVSYEVILVDNASTEQGIENILTEFPDLIFVQSSENIGFAGGNNLGIRKSSGKYILLLNSDTLLTNNAIFTTWKYMEQHPAAGVVSARLMFPNGDVQSVCQRFPSLKYSTLELLRVQKFLSRSKGGKLLLGSFFDHNENTTADWVWGAYFMFRSQLLDKMPGRQLNDRYFMYCEDMQWCWDIARLGYEIHYCADATVVHLMGGSSGKKEALMQQNLDDFLKRNHSSLYLFFLNKIQSMLHKNTLVRS